MYFHLDNLQYKQGTVRSEFVTSGQRRVGIKKTEENKVNHVTY